MQTLSCPPGLRSQQWTTHLSDPRTADMSIVCRDGSVVPCHRLLLAQSSPLVNQALRDDADLDTLIAPDFSREVVEKTMKMLVEGEASFRRGEMDAFADFVRLMRLSPLELMALLASESSREGEEEEEIGVSAEELDLPECEFCGLGYCDCTGEIGGEAVYSDDDGGLSESMDETEVPEVLPELKKKKKKKKNTIPLDQRFQSSDRTKSQMLLPIQVEPQEWLCFLCSKIFPQRSLLLGHLSTRHFQQELKAFSRSFKKVKDDDGKKLLTCLVCRRTFNSKNRLNIVMQHMGAHHGKVLDFLPDDVREALSAAQSAQQKYKDVRVVVDNKVGVSCELCSRQFPNVTALRQHHKLVYGQQLSLPQLRSLVLERKSGVSNVLCHN